MPTLKFILPKRVKKNTEISDFYASELYKRIRNPYRSKDNIGVIDNEPKKIYKWEEKLFKDNKKMPKHKTFHNIKQMSLDECYKFVNKTFKDVFVKLTFDEACNCLMYRQYSHFFTGDGSTNIPKIMPFFIINKKKYLSRADASLMSLSPKNNYFLHHDVSIKGLFEWYYDKKVDENKITVKDVQELFDKDEDREPHQWYDIHGRTKKISILKKDKMVRLSYRPVWCGMHLPPWARNKFIMLHEVAHLLARNNNGHGSDYVAVLAYLYHKYLKLNLHVIVNSLKENKIYIDTKHSLLYKYFHEPMNEFDLRLFSFDKY